MKRKVLAAAVCLVVAAGCTRDQWQRFPGPDDMVALVPWFSNMYRGPAIGPYKMPEPRPPVPGTIPVTGNEPPTPITADPADLARINALRNPGQRTAASLERGELMYSIYCLPCHGDAGAGDGPVNRVLMVTPSLLEDRARRLSDGYLYAIIRHGRGVMPAQGDRVLPEDRWHIVNYVRVLQGAAR